MTKTEPPIWIRHILPSCVLGTIITLVLVSILGQGVTSRWLLTSLWPGLAACQSMGYALGTWRASVLLVFIDSMFFSALMFFILLIARRR